MLRNTRAVEKKSDATMGKVTYHSIKLFRDLAQTRSFSKAAEMNDMSQSAASQKVQDLERIMGGPLVDRSRRPLVVTPAGQLYAEFCRDILERQQLFEDALGRLKQQVEGTVRFATIYSVGLSEMVQL